MAKTVNKFNLRPTHCSRSAFSLSSGCVEMEHAFAWKCIISFVEKELNLIKKRNTFSNVRIKDGFCSVHEENMSATECHDVPGNFAK